MVFLTQHGSPHQALLWAATKVETPLPTTVIKAQIFKDYVTEAVWKHVIKAEGVRARIFTLDPTAIVDVFRPTTFNKGTKLEAVVAFVRIKTAREQDIFGRSGEGGVMLKPMQIG